MRLTEISFGNEVPVDGYGPGFFRVGGRVIEGGVLVGPDGAVAWGGGVSDLLALAGRVDVILIGTGDRMDHLPADLRVPLEEAGIGVEPMASPTAARSYNVLLSEGRRVACALQPVGC